MKDLELKKNVLKEIMDLMDSREGDRLKGLKAKAAPVKIEVETESEPEDEMQEDEGMESKGADGEESEMDLSPEMLEMLLAKLKEQE